MKLRTRLTLFFLLSVFVSTGMQAYILGPGDTISIDVLTRKDLSTQQAIAPDGSLFLPLLDRQIVAGQTLESFQSDLKAKYGTYLKSPVLSIVLTPKPIYIVQHDRKTGLIQVHETVSLKKAAALTGGSIPESELVHGERYHVDIGKMPGFWDKNWYKIVTAVAIGAGVLQSVSD